jgi:uncharacterized protein (DUF1330 family)
MTYIDPTPEQNAALLAYPSDQPLQMLNLLKFKHQSSDTASGAAQYAAYMKAALPFFEQSKARVLFYGEAKLCLIGPAGDLEWDKVLIVEYPTKQAFLQMVTDPEYPAQLRRDALADSRLILCASR